MPKWFALALCSAGALMLAMAVRQSSRGRESRHWTRTLGRVVESRVELLNEADEQRSRRWGFVIRYAYEARGRAQGSRQIWIGSAGVAYEDEERALEWVERFPKGAEVTVWFDPAAPSQAVLVPGVPGAQVALLVLAGLALVGIGIFLLSRA
ncbi:MULTISPECIES: DUF3592 domain-containing protein [Anaeromyxobacter]|uniref:DUF3592 domain-containing protein n=1 Tax=Anaeromyxobacter TaxID=161492 RepID=UPI001F574C64|nr:MULTISPECIES: DUF3592 domain-containing protein [unclassified Anaeromyxobacter]